MPEPAQYKSPPIVERIVGVYYRIPQEEFERKLPPWIERIAQSYPVPGHLAEWLIDIEEKNGVPFVKSLVPKARIIHLFWRNHPEKKHVFGMRIRPDRLVFHLCREADNPHRFDELLPEMEHWLPAWQEHFGVPHLDGVAVEYVNVLDGKITPQFVAKDGSLKIAEALTMFANFPGSSRGFSAPLDSKVRLVIDEQKPIYFDIRVRGDERSKNAVRVDFNVRIFPHGKTLSPKEAIEELRTGHRVMLEQFTCFFTEKARASFSV